MSHRQYKDNRRRTVCDLEVLDDRTLLSQGIIRPVVPIIPDDRIPPTVTHAGMHTTALADTDTASTSAQVQARHERQLARRLQKKERAAERAEKRLERRAARFLAHHPDLSAAAARAAASAPAGTPVLLSIANFGDSRAPASTNVATPSTPTSATPTSTMPTGSNSTNTGSTTSAQSGGSTTSSATVSSLPANVAQVLSVIYAEYAADPSGFTGVTTTANGASLVVVQGDNVGIQVRDGNVADFSTLVTELQNSGMQITNSDATDGLIVGMLPISQLPTVAMLPQTPSVTPMLQPNLN